MSIDAPSELNLPETLIIVLESNSLDEAAKWFENLDALTINLFTLF